MCAIYSQYQVLMGVAHTPSPHCVHCNFFAKLEIVYVCTVTMTRLVIQLCGFRSKTCHTLISVNYCINVLASNIAGNIRATAINFRQARKQLQVS